MADVKLVVLYPRPEDAAVFEEVYHRKYLPLAVETRRQDQDCPNEGIGLPQAIPPSYRIAGVHFPSMQALEARVASEGGKEVLAHAVKISSGGPRIFFVAEKETLTFTQTAVG